MFDIKSEEEFDEFVLGADPDTLVLVDFWATWCPPCRALTPILENVVAKGRAKAMQKGSKSIPVALAKIDVDEQTMLAAQFGITAMPTVIAFRDGNEVGKFIGALPPQKVMEFVKEHSK
ncbi:thioredoxin [Ramicandelaber brevisporus]|nr:thioredoxin [Ramicandelaber brevisporus]